MSDREAALLREIIADRNVARSARDWLRFKYRALLAAEEDAAREPGIDVERLRQVLANGQKVHEDLLATPTAAAIWYAAEYARLASSDPQEAEREAR